MSFIVSSHRVAILLRLYDDGKMVVIDLAGPPAGSGPSAAP